MNWVPEKHRVKDNIDLISFKTEKFKTSVLKVSLVAPSKLGAKDASHFSLMVNLLRSGTEKYPEKEDIIKRLNDLYDASCYIGGFASGDNRILEISSEMLDERFSGEESIIDGVLGVMNEMLLHPRCDVDGCFRDEAVQREKKVICDKIRSEKNNSRDYALRKCREIMCRNEPYGQMTEIPEIMSADRKELTAFYKKFLSEAKVTFSYVGALDGTTVAEKIRDLFSDLECRGNADLNHLAARTVSEVKEIEEELNIKQGVLTIGIRTGVVLGDSDAHVMPVLNNVFGGTFMSRLFKILRESMSLCYSCSSDYVSTKAVMYVSCGIDVSNFEKSKSEILNQLSKLKSELAGEDELRIAKDLAKKELREMYDYPSAIATFCYGRAIYGIDESPDQLAEKIESVTAEDVLRVAQKLEVDTVFFLKGTKQDETDEEDSFDE